VNNYQIILYILYWHKCQCWQVAQHECKFRICSIRCLESCRLDMLINCLRKMEKATSSVNTLTAAFSKSCLVTVFICLTLFCRGALLSRRSFFVALFCRCALLLLRSYCGSILSRAQHNHEVSLSSKFCSNKIDASVFELNGFKQGNRQTKQNSK
jgi:hypothetical protein